MAFKPTSTISGGSLGLSSVDGVEVRIADKYIPPKKVTLPMKLETSFQSHNPSDVLFMEYDFSLEEEVIKWTDTYKESREALNRVQAEQVSTNVEQFTQQPPDGSTEPKFVDEEKPEDVATSETNVCDSIPNGDFHLIGPGEEPPPKPMIQSKPKPDANPLVTGLGLGILVPMQIPASKPQDNAVGAKESFDLADFERETEQDPFDNAELRVMNDMEELNKVLQNVASSASQPVAHEFVPTSQAGAGTIDGNSQGFVTQATQIVSHPMVTSQIKTASQTVASPPIPPRKNIPKSVKEIDYPSLDTVENNYQPNVAPGYYNNMYGSPQKHLPSNGLNYAMPNMYGGSQTNAVAYPSNFTGANNFSSSAVSYNKNQNCVVGAMFPAKPTVSQTTEAGHASKTISESANRQASSTYNVLSHGAGYPTRDTITARSTTGLAVNGLRSVRSTPDISALADNARVYFPKSHTPPPNLHTHNSGMDNTAKATSHWSHNLSQDGRSSTPPPKYTPYQPSTNPWGPPNSHHQPPPEYSPGRATSTLPDPYHGLSSEKQTLVDSITAMGFPRARVARVAQKLGSDGKKIVDQLCLMTRLIEKNYPADDVEMALGLYDNNERQAKIYLKLVQRFSELGFPLDSIKSALSESKLDENKTLDLLTGNT